MEKQPVISFVLDNYIRYGNENSKVITCADVAPFNDFEIGDYLEIDLDKIAMKEDSINIFDDVSIVRKVSSVANVISSRGSSSFTNMVIGSTTITREQRMAMVRELDNYVEQSGGRNEYTAHIEVQDNQGKPIKFSISSKRVN